jgi:hypothetical protein
MERDHFKQRLPVKNRAGLANWFLYPIRAGIDEPQIIVDRVLEHCQEKMRWHPAPLIANLIVSYRHEAEAYAALLIEQEKLSIPNRRSERGRRNRMRKEPPTAKQTYVIQKAGQVTPANRADAHDQISQLRMDSPIANLGRLFGGDEND